MNNALITLIVKEDRTGPVVGRHPWVFSRALKNIPDGVQSGAPVKLVSESGRFLAQGYFNSYSQMAVRIWGFDEKEIVDDDFFNKRVGRALDIRKKYVETDDTDSYRLINAENDMLPGLIVDKYADCLVIQCHTRGIEYWKESIIKALVNITKPKGIYERSEGGSRKVEGAEEKSGLLFGDVPDIIAIRENGLKFLVDVKKGQKTGFYLDQRDKRSAIKKYSRDKSLLNAFSYTGAFSVYALSGGAKSVTNVDMSMPALELARENIRINGFDPDRHDFICEDVKKYLREIRKGQFNIIVLDPPAFIKDRRKKNDGIVGYKAINEFAMRALPEDGILLTCSCSSHLTPEDFRFVISEAGGKAGRTLQMLETYGHGIDHHELAPFTEGRYLKCHVIKCSS